MSEPLVLINLFSMPAGLVDDLVDQWDSNIAAAKGPPGFRGTRLHRSLDPAAKFPVVNIARWDSVEDWRAAFEKHLSGPGRSGDGEREPPEATGDRDAVSAHPTLYAAAHVTPDPRATAPGAQS